MFMYMTFIYLTFLFFFFFPPFSFCQLRFGKIDKYVSNTNVFEHSGKLYSIAESHMPQEIDVFTLETVGNWVLSRQWNRPFTSHPKVLYFILSAYIQNNKYIYCFERITYTQVLHLTFFN